MGFFNAGDENNTPYSWGGIGEQLLGTLTGGVGGYLGSMGLKLLTDSTSNTTRNANQGFLQDAQKFATANLFNAAGRTGADTTSSFDQQFNSLQNSAEARNAANMQNQMAGRALGSAQGTMDSASRTAQRGLGTQTRSILDTVRQQGGSPAAMMAIANRMGDLTSQGIAGQAGQQNQVAQQSIGQAAGMYGNSSQILNQDLQNRYQTYVKPFEAQNSGLGNQMVQSVPGAMQSASESRSATNPLSGLSQTLGYLGGNQVQQPWLNQDYIRNQQMFNKSGAPGLPSLERLGARGTGQIGGY